MSDRDILVIGDYPDWDRTAMEAAFDLHSGSPGSLVAEDAARIRAVAFKGHGHLTAEDMDALPNLGLIANFGVGYDAIDISAATARGIAVTNTPDVLTDDVADLAVGMLIAVTRQFVRTDAWVRTGDWAAKGDYPLLRKVSGKRVGIVGLGRLGRALAVRLSAFSMPISYTPRAPNHTPSG